MKVRIGDQIEECEGVEDLEDAIQYAIDSAYDSGVDSGREDGYDDGYDAAKQELESGTPEDLRAQQFRLDLYRAIYAEDMEKAEDMINLMAMVDIDRDLIWQAKREVRK